MNVRGKSGFLRKFLFIKFSTTCSDKRIKSQGMNFVKGERELRTLSLLLFNVMSDVAQKMKIFSIMHKPSTVCCDFLEFHMYTTKSVCEEKITTKGSFFNAILMSFLELHAMLSFSSFRGSRKNTQLFFNCVDF